MQGLAHAQALQNNPYFFKHLSFMTISSIIQNIPCTLVTGFLGAGKTTVINQLLSTKPLDARWALLINEFGRIGIDGALLTQDNSNPQDIAISEVSGGCICCTSQLPLQIALSRLLSEHRPQRLIIEPTGLAHPRELLRQLSEPHWQTALNMQAVIAVLSAVQWQDAKYRNHEGFQAHICAADVVVINRYKQLSSTCQKQMHTWITELNPQAQLIWAEPPEECETASSKLVTANLTRQLNTPSQIISQQTDNLSQYHVRLQPPMPLLSPKTGAINTDIVKDETLPYRYHNSQQGIFQQNMMVGGWRLPAEWMFNADALQQWLLALPEWQRIKGVVNTSDGWLQLNFTPDSLSTTTTSAQVDSRLEIILLNKEGSDINVEKTTKDKTEIHRSQANWAVWDNELMALVL